MDKEKLITIGIGLLVGIASAAIYFFLSRNLPTRQQDKTKVTFSPPGVPSDTSKMSQPLSVIIDKPDDHSSVAVSPISISGKSQAGVKLVVFTNADEKIASADASGNFQLDVKLEDGENEISIAAINNQGNIFVIKKNVTLEISP